MIPELVVNWWASVEPYLPLLLSASLLAVQITIVTVIGTWLVGLAIALLKASKYKVLRAVAEGYIWFIRGTPLLIQIFIFYFGLPQLGVTLSAPVAGTLALSLNGGAYVAEIIRGGLLSIPKGQRESAIAIGMSYAHMMKRIVLPQIVRVILPPVTNQAILTLKETSLLSTITVMELTLRTILLINSTFRPFEFYAIAAILYLSMTSILVVLLKWVERRYALY